MKNIVVVGGGSGIFNVLKGLKQYPLNLTAIVTTFDNGGSTGLLRDEFGILPPGDIRRALIALAPETGDSTLRDLFTFRFERESSLRGHSFGNLFLQALTAVVGSDIGAIKKAGEILGSGGVVLPVSLDDAQICAQLADGTIIQGETNIDIPKYDGALRIKKIYLAPHAAIYREAYEALLHADLVVLGPGDLYTSLIPNVLVGGFAEALGKSKAKVVFVTNLMTKWGETHGFAASDFSRVALRYMKRKQFDYVICNTSPLRPALIKKYAIEKAYPVPIDIAALKKYAKHIMLEDVASQSDVLRHDNKKISRAILGLLRT